MIAKRKIGKNEMIGPVSSTPIRLAPQPHWKTATTMPKAAPMLSRFISIAFSGTQTERKTIISNSAESRTTTPMKSGSLSAIALPKSEDRVDAADVDLRTGLLLDRGDHLATDVVEQLGGIGA